jgi:hypothetical protein
MIGEGFPSPRKLIDNEINTLKFFRDNTILWEHYKNFARDSDALYSKALSKKRTFGFESYLDILVDQRVGKAYVGARIIPSSNMKSYDDISYHLAVCENQNNGNPVLKKLHFDFADPTRSYKQPHPVFHFQHPGKLTPALSEFGYDISHLSPWLSEPRLPYYPMTLALLVNCVLREFPDGISQDLIERHEWRSLIKKDEELVLAPYYKQCSDFIKKRQDNVYKGIKFLLTNDFYYGKY